MSPARACRALLAGCSIVVATGLAALLPCRYTVRDIGFVDLSGADAELVWFAEQDPDELARVPWESNLSTRAGSEAERSSAGERHFALRAPQRGLLLLEADEAGLAVREALDSTTRTELVARALDSFCTVLWFHGADEDLERVRGVIEGGQESLERVKEALPRPIDRPLAVVHVPHELRERERVLAWFLGVEVGAAESALCVLYGRGKLAGEVLVGAAITEAALLEDLALVGDSCECDFGREWASLPRVPLRWGAEQRGGAATSLGFDPESPLVRAEVARILARGPTTGAALRSAGDPLALVYGYRETELVGGSPALVAGSSSGVSTLPATGPAAGLADVRVFEGEEGDDWSFDEQSPASGATGPGPDRSGGGPHPGRGLPARGAPLPIHSWSFSSLIMVGLGITLVLLLVFLILIRGGAR